MKVTHRTVARMWLGFCGMWRNRTTLLFLLYLGSLQAQQYDLLLRRGHVIDPKNRINAVRDIAIRDGKIAAVAESINSSSALKTVDLSGLYVSPGFIDIHAHFWGTPGAALYPDSHTLRSGVTTVVDAGGSGWRTFPSFRKAAMETALVRVLAWLNIVGRGMDGRPAEQNTEDMDPKQTAAMVAANRDRIVGIKTAHFDGPEWAAVERAVEAGTIAKVPVMVDFGTFRKERPFQDLVLHKLRPGDIYTHLYLNSVPMLDDKQRVQPYLFEARKRGVLFDAGHGQGSFLFRQAAPAVRQGFIADTISTDLHVGSINAGMKDMATVMSKFLILGVSLEEVIARSTWAPARSIHREELGHLSVNAPADIAVFRVEKGDFGYVDSYKAAMRGSQRIVCELTLRDGKVAWELNGITRESWDKLGEYGSQGDPRWDATSEDGKNSRLPSAKQPTAAK